MKAEERAQRDARVLQLWLAGASYQQIAEAIGVKSKGTIHHIIQRELADANERRKLLADEAYAMYQERLERLFQAHWGLALKGDHKSAMVCQRLLAQQARLYGLEADTVLPSPTMPVDLAHDEAEDELAQLRARRAT